MLYTGIYAGWLIALLAWLLASTRSTGAQLVFIWLCTAPIHALGFKHSIAGSVEAFYLSAAGKAEWTTTLTQFRGALGARQCHWRSPSGGAVELRAGGGGAWEGYG